MNVNGVTNQSITNSYQTYTKKTDLTKESKETTTTSGVIYEPNTDLVNKMKADLTSRTDQLQSIVEKMLIAQGNKASSIFDILRSGNFSVDEETKKQAQSEISDTGYWGVEQTSDRMIEFAKAVSGNDPDQIEKMRAAFEKGFKQAEKTWGGKLPEISQKTYEATMSKFDAWASEANDS
ncbi:MAG: hypothetical protein ACRC7V_00670 [Lachnospiraceae bacterium]